MEYKDGKGRSEARDSGVGAYESQRRKAFLKSFLPGFRIMLVQAVGETFSVKVVGSVAADMATTISDIDLLIQARSNTTKYQKDVLVIESMKTLQLLEAQDLPFKIEL